jgi:L-alanine-DL-glutamate epimerase-like enolase superfamily enzyme
VRYFSNAGDSQGRRGQPMVNQSTNVVMIETEGGLIGIGEGGEPTSMDECAWPNDRPGLGVELDVSKLTLLGEYDTYRAGMLLNHRPDGSYTNW